jgi:hypothetical protein
MGSVRTMEYRIYVRRSGGGVGGSVADAEASQRTHHGRDHRRGTVLPHRQPGRRRKPRRGFHSLGQARDQQRGPGEYLRHRAVHGPGTPGSARRADPARARPVLHAQRAHRRPGDPQGLLGGRLHRAPPGHRLVAVLRSRRARRLHVDRARPAPAAGGRPRRSGLRCCGLRGLTGSGGARSSGPPSPLPCRPPGPRRRRHHGARRRGGARGRLRVRRAGQAECLRGSPRREWR